MAQYEFRGSKGEHHEHLLLAVAQAAVVFRCTVLCIRAGMQDSDLIACFGLKLLKPGVTTVSLIFATPARGSIFKLRFYFSSSGSILLIFKWLYFIDPIRGLGEKLVHLLQSMESPRLFLQAHDRALPDDRASVHMLLPVLVSSIAIMAGRASGGRTIDVSGDCAPELLQEFWMCILVVSLDRSVGGNPLSTLSTCLLEPRFDVTQWNKELEALSSSFDHFILLSNDDGARALSECGFRFQLLSFRVRLNFFLILVKVVEVFPELGASVLRDMLREGVPSTKVFGTELASRKTIHRMSCTTEDKAVSVHMLVCTPSMSLEGGLGRVHVVTHGTGPQVHLRALFGWSSK